MLLLPLLPLLPPLLQLAAWQVVSSAVSSSLLSLLWLQSLLL